MAQDTKDTRASEWLDLLLTEEGQRAVALFSSQLQKRRFIGTRNKLKRATVGCRWWQLIYAAVIVSPFSPSLLLRPLAHGEVDDPEYQRMVKTIRDTIQYISSYKQSALYRIIYGNEVIKCPIRETAQERELRLQYNQPEIPCIMTMDESFVDTAEDGRYYVCIYTEGDRTDIAHYFVLIRRGGVNGEWYISSSYGSEWVEIPALTQSASEQDIRHMLVSMNHMDEERHKERLRRVFQRYFLQPEASLRIRYSDTQYENNPKRKGQFIPRGLGVTSELDTVLNSNSRLQMGYIQHMEENVAHEIQSMLGGGRGGRGRGGRGRGGRGSRGRIQGLKSGRRHLTRRSRGTRRGTRRGREMGRRGGWRGF